jgi:hypothetical protein
MQHDIAVTKWFSAQYSAMALIGLDDQGLVRLASYKEFSKIETSAEDVLRMQRSAIHEFVTVYRGDDKEPTLAKWLIVQGEAQKALSGFLEKVKVNASNKPIDPKRLNPYEASLESQDNYLEAMRRYREGWRDRDKQE